MISKAKKKRNATSRGPSRRVRKNENKEGGGVDVKSKSRPTS